MRSVATDLHYPDRALPYFPSVLVFDRSTVARFLRLHRSFETPVSSLERETRLRDFLAALTAEFSETRPAVPSYQLEKQAVDRVCDFLRANYAENVSLAQLAELANLSTYHFSRVFTAQCGIPPHEFLVQLRLAHAKQFLREGVGIALVAFQTGFADQSHLTRHFKRMFGVTPGQYAGNQQERSRLSR
jgi:transcriptional regulator GlxA family with amidase domain